MKNRKLLVLILSIVVVICSISLTACNLFNKNLVNFENLVFESTTVTYNGDMQSITVKGLPQGATVTYKGEQGYVDAGKYGLTVVVSADGYKDKELSATLTIQKATLTIKPQDLTVVPDEEILPELVIDGFVGDDSLQDIDILPTFSGIANYALGLHEEAIEMSGAQDNNYDFVYEKADLTVVTYKFIEEGQYLLYGAYPQSVVSNQTIIDALNSGIKNNSIIADANGYYTYNGRRYVSLVATPHSYIDNFNLFANGNEIENKEYFFVVQPIKWKVLEEGGKKLVVSDIIIDLEQFNADPIATGGQNSNEYKNSDIRKWLNSNFIQSAFANSEFIDTTSLENGSSVGRPGDKYNENSSCEDKIFLLSYADVVNSGYGFETSGDANECRETLLSDFAIAQGAFLPNGATGYWWLRSGADTIRTVVVVKPDGDANTTYYSVTNKSCGVRPAFYFVGE